MAELNSDGEAGGTLMGQTFRMECDKNLGVRLMHGSKRWIRRHRAAHGSFFFTFEDFFEGFLFFDAFLRATSWAAASAL